MQFIHKLIVAGLVGWLSSSAAAYEDDGPLPPSKGAIALDAQIDWTRAGQIAVQDAGRYKTLESFARESMSAMTGKESLPGLSPLASLIEWLFNRGAYADEAVVYIKDKGLRHHFGAHLPAAERAYLLKAGKLTPRQLGDRTIMSRMRELETQFQMVSAMRRVRNAQFVALRLDAMINLVPPPASDPLAPWHTPTELVANLPDDVIAGAGLQRAESARPIPGISGDQAVKLLAPWARLQKGWRGGDAAGVQAALNDLATALPAAAAPGVYPSESQRAAETKYYRMGKFTWGWVIYFVGALVSCWALVTNWRVPWVLGLLLLLAGMGLHAYGLGLRWYILGRIPVANMFEAVVASAWMGIALALVLEFFFRTRVFAFSANMAGFFALMLGQYVIPGSGTLTTMMGILDDVMLRIHTVLIIASYALIFIASMIAVVYLFAYYVRRHPWPSLQSSLVLALCGGVLYLVAPLMFVGAEGLEAKRAGLGLGFGLAAALMLAYVVALVRLGASGLSIAIHAILVISLATLGIGNQGFIWGTGLSFAGAGLLWALATGAGLLLSHAAAPAPRVALAGVGALRLERPILAGGAPGDEGHARDLPAWLHHLDWSHLIILNMVFVMLFVGIILGAVWADYSWGRPWGWDPKEVFAMNTWIIYAILIHMRFAVKQRGLWTAWLSVAGCLMMAFNWCFVNFFIVGLHSYA